MPGAKPWWMAAAHAFLNESYTESAMRPQCGLNVFSFCVANAASDQESTRDELPMNVCASKGMKIRAQNFEPDRRKLQQKSIHPSFLAVLCGRTAYSRSGERFTRGLVVNSPTICIMIVQTVCERRCRKSNTGQPATHDMGLYFSRSWSSFPHRNPMILTIRLIHGAKCTQGG